MRNVKWIILAVVTLCVGAQMPSFAADIPWGEDKTRPDYPPIFEERSVGQRLAAEEVARQDAYRKLLERIYGLSIDSRTTVQDLALASREIDTALTGRLKGMREVDKKYYPDGRVEIAAKVTVRKVVEIIEKTYTQVEKNNRLVSQEVLENVKRENRDRDLYVVGRGALPNSPGMEKIQAMRAAEVDCYERIAARVFGLEIKGQTTVRDFTLQSDDIQSSIAVHLPGGVRFADYAFFDDGSCEATGKITMRKVIEILKRTYRRHTEDSKLVKLEDISDLERVNRDTVITEVGKGTVRKFEEMGLAEKTEAFEEEKTAIRHVLERTERKERVIEKKVGVEDQ